MLLCLKKLAESVVWKREMVGNCKKHWHISVEECGEVSRQKLENIWTTHLKPVLKLPTRAWRAQESKAMMMTAVSREPF